LQVLDRKAYMQYINNVLIQLLPAIMKKIFLIILIGISLTVYSQKGKANNRLFVINISGTQIMSLPNTNSTRLIELKVGDEIIVIEKRFPVFSKFYKNERMTLKDYWIKTKYNGFTGFVFNGDLTKIKPALTEVENNYGNKENFFCASILGKKLSFEEKKRIVKYGDKEFTIIDEITNYENGKLINYNFDGCYNSKYIFNKLTFNEVYQQMKNNNFIYGFDGNSFMIEYPMFKEKKEDKYIFYDLGLTDQVEIIKINNTEIQLETGGCN